MARPTIEAVAKAAEALGLAVSRIDPWECHVVFRGYRLRIDAETGSNPAVVFRGVIYSETFDYGFYRLNKEIASVGAILTRLVSGHTVTDEATDRQVLVTCRVRRNKIEWPYFQREQEKEPPYLYRYNEVLFTDDPVFRDWVAGKVTDGMLLDYVWDEANWR
jgi:hypothetical protein